MLEILVVVAVTALLVAVLVPALANARRQADKVTCQTRLKQLTTAWHQYLDANASRFPHGQTMHIDYGGKQGSAGPYKLPKPLNPYLKVPAVSAAADVFSCPSDSGSGDPKVAKCYDFYGASYKANRFLIGLPDPFASPLDRCGAIVDKNKDRLASVTRNQISNESRLVLLGDYGWEDEWNVASTVHSNWHYRAKWHNIAFMDGHADFVRIYRGVYVTSRYVLIPFKSLLPDLARMQPQPDERDKPQ